MRDSSPFEAMGHAAITGQILKSLGALRAFIGEFWDESLARLKLEAEQEQKELDNHE